MDQLTLGTKVLEVKPMTWGTQKQVFKLIARALGSMDAAKGAAAAFIKATAGGDQEATLAPFFDLVAEAPELLTDVLALGLGVDKEDIDIATGPQVITALEAFIQENALDEQWARAKKAFSLLRHQDKAAG